MKEPRSPLARFTLLIALLAALPGSILAAEPPPKPSKAKVEAPAVQLTPVPKSTLIFFMNPAGRPCQNQDQILKESRAQWEPLANLRYVRTDVAADRDVFYQYGVRSLPNLILVGADGKEILRFSPGIQSGEAVASGVRSKSGH